MFNFWKKKKKKAIRKKAASKRRFFSFSFGFKTKIYLAMGSVCALLGILAWIALWIVSDNLKTSAELTKSSRILSKNVEGVSASIKTTLEKQQKTREAFTAKQEKQNQANLVSQVELYERILAITEGLAETERQGNLIVNEGEGYEVMKASIAEFTKVLDLFFKLPEMRGIDETILKKAKRAGRGYLQMWDEVRLLDEENVSLSQQAELAGNALEIGKSLRTRLDKLLAEVHELSKKQKKEQSAKTRELLDTTKIEDQNTLASILNSQADIKRIVKDNVEEINSLETSLLLKRRYLIVVVGIALGLGLIFSVLIVHVISRPLRRAVAIAGGIAEGDLDQTVDIRGDDEIGRLGASMSIMIDKLRANHIEIEKSSTDLDKVANTLSSSLEEISAAMEQIHAMAGNNADKAGTADSMTQETRENVEKGRGNISEMLSAMKEVNEAGQEIAKIIKVINDIAFQTKLLALNAAVEAAHAGEQGQGFAVVAEEVRGLAGRCSTAAADTTELIEGPLKKIGHASKVADRSAKTFDVINKNIVSMANLIKEISTASKEQTTGIEQANVGLGQIDHAAQNLTIQTDHLRQTLEHFKKQKNGDHKNDQTPQLPRW